jgi:hypothetical protein
MKRLPLFILVVLSIIFLIITIPIFVLNPSLYTIYQGAYTQYHSDPAVLGVYSHELSPDVSAFMQELLNAPEPIVLDLKVRDFEEAERALNEYKEKSKYFNQVVIHLDLTESAIGDFQQENRKNLVALEKIINDSAQFDQINRLEIQYRSEDNPALLYSITYQGKAVQNAIEKSAKDYIDREPKIIAIGNQLDLNTTDYQESGELLKDVLEADQAQQETRNQNQPVLNISSLSLAVAPDTGHYGDTIQVTGAYSFMLLPEVTLMLDSKDWKTVMPDQNGIFGSAFAIGTIHTGDHFLLATSNNRYSNIATFSVVSVDPNLTLTMFPGKQWGEVAINGSLVADVQPVINAPIVILVDEFERMTVETDENGYYNAMLSLPPGNHTIQSSFDDPAFPLNPAVSDIHSVTVSSPERFMVSVLLGTGIILFSFLISIWYLRRSSLPIESVFSEPPLLDTVPLHGRSTLEPDFRDDVLGQYQTLFEKKEWSEAAHLLYRSLIERIDVLHVLSGLVTMTPRELSSLLSKMLQGAPVRSFINRYEEIRYGGFPLSHQDPLLTEWLVIISRVGEEKNA